MNNMAQLTVSKALDTSRGLDVKFPFKAKYGNFINGQWEEPKSGEYFDNTSPITGEVICEIARSNAEDVEFALDAAHGAKGFGQDLNNGTLKYVAEDCASY